MRTIILRIIAVFITVIYFSCEDAKFVDRDYPLVVMLDAKVRSTGVTLNAEIKILGSYEILEKGFVWTKDENVDPTIDANDVVYLNSELNSNRFSIEITGGLESNTLYFVRPFVRTTRFMVYGEKISFVSQGGSTPVINNFQPRYGPFNASIKISGENLGFSNDAIVKFGGIKTTIDSAFDSVLYVRVPNIQSNELVNITLEFDGTIAQSPGSFEIYFPWRKLDKLTHNIEAGSQSFVIGERAYIINANTSSGLSYDAISDVWKGFNLPEYAGSNPQAFAIGRKGYALLSSKFWEFDEITGIWTQKADFPGQIRGRQSSYTMASEFVGFIGLCYNGLSIQDFSLWSYDPVLDQWSSKSELPGLQLGWVSGNFSFSLSHSGYLGTSTNSGAHFYQYNFLADSWSIKSGFPLATTDLFASMVINGQAYLGLGVSQNERNPLLVNTFYHYNEINDSWNEYQLFPYGIGSHSSFGVGSKGYIFVGLTVSSAPVAKEIWVFDPTRN